MEPFEIREARDEDRDSIWGIIREVIATGDTYVFSPDSDRQKMLDYWCGPDKHTYVVSAGGKVEGTFIIKDNFEDLGSHVANASFMTRSSSRGSGIGTRMGEFALTEAGKLGYLAMQFNMVVKTNTRAIRLWEKLGFKILCEVPAAFRHSEHGLTGAYIMRRDI